MNGFTYGFFGFLLLSSNPVKANPPEGKAVSGINTSQGYWRIEGTGHHRINATSGGSGEEVRIRPKKNAFLYSINWSESSDQPCHLRTHGLSFNNKKNEDGWVTNSAIFGENIDKLLCDYKSSSDKSIGFYDPGNFYMRASSKSPMRVIRSIRICTNKNKKKSYKEILKGLEIKSAILKSDGSISTENTTERVERPNCKTWHAEVKCPTGEAATGLYINYARPTSNLSAAIRGISLECAKPKKVLINNSKAK